MKTPRTCRLKTPFENGNANWNVYPRPQMERKSFLPLCETWQLSVIKGEHTLLLGDIQVPFPPESPLSGIERLLEDGEHYLYEKTFCIEESFVNETVLLHFGAVDQIAKVTLNGVYLGRHVGGYLPFTFDVTEHIRIGENNLQVEVYDDLDTDIPYGKQSKNRGGMWYTPISGIWQTVWMESVPKTYIKGIRLTPSLKNVIIEVAGGEIEKRLTIKTPSGIIEHKFFGNKTLVEIENPVLWTPENPHLYPFTIASGKDFIKSYFALRTITTKTVNGKPYLALNGKPYFFHGLLDQGYYSDGIYLPASPEGYRYDIQTMKSLGFNMLRKHIKIEPETFYYDCDRYGMIVFQDMVNSGKYHFVRDTVLPTVGLKVVLPRKVTQRRRKLFESEAQRTISHLHNHPCVCYYTIFNEGWGQYDADRLYLQYKALDPTRIFDTTSGWFEENNSDVKSEHIYFRKVQLSPSNRPLVLSEFGGYSCKIKGHSYNLDKTYGYRYFEDKESFMNAIENLYGEEIVPMIEKGLCATVLTQVSDVEDETNGLFTYDRQVLKVDKARMNSIAREIFDAFEKNL